MPPGSLPPPLLVFRSYAIEPPHSSRATDDDRALALSALAWIVKDERRAERFLGLTGLTPTDLRSRADSLEVGAATIRYLAGHEPELLACAQAIDVSAPALVAAGERLEA